MLDISRQLAYTKLGSRGKYQPMQYSWVHTSRLLRRLPSSYMPFAYPTNLLQYPDRTAFALAVLMLPSLGTATYTCCGGLQALVGESIILHDLVVKHNTGCSDGLQALVGKYNPA